MYTFDYRRAGAQFEVSPDGLRDALAHACGTDAALYVRRKQAQLDELGYGDDRYHPRIASRNFVTECLSKDVTD
jgi:hypothetical protein